MNKDIRHLRELVKQHQRLTNAALKDHRDLTRLLSDERHEATLMNVKTALESLNERLLKLNEFRAQQADIIARFATSEKLDAVVAALNQRISTQAKEIDELKLARSKDQGRGQIISVIWALMASIIVVLISKAL